MQKVLNISVKEFSEYTILSSPPPPGHEGENILNKENSQIPKTMQFLSKMQA
jgi:hypothetical protein